MVEATRAKIPPELSINWNKSLKGCDFDDGPVFHAKVTHNDAEVQQCQHATQTERIQCLVGAPYYWMGQTMGSGSGECQRPAGRSDCWRRSRPSSSNRHTSDKGHDNFPCVSPETWTENGGNMATELVAISWVAWIVGLCRTPARICSREHMTPVQVALQTKWFAALL